MAPFIWNPALCWEYTPHMPLIWVYKAWPVAYRPWASAWSTYLKEIFSCPEIWNFSSTASGTHCALQFLDFSWSIHNIEDEDEYYPSSSNTHKTILSKLITSSTTYLKVKMTFTALEWCLQQDTVQSAYKVHKSKKVLWDKKFQVSVTLT